MGLSELYHATGRDDYRQAFEHLWWSMLKGDRHNNGGFSSGEKATGNPYDGGAIETCCTVAWMAMSVEMLRLTGNSVVADELELSMLNSGLGMMSPSGRWVTYNTPMAGERQASAHTIVFQARAGTPELNCCSVNGPRALGLLCEWAVMRRADGLALNYYGPCTLKTPLATLAQTTDYPRGGKVGIVVTPATQKPFTLALRIPHWSEKTRLRLNGKPVPDVKPGAYCELSRKWKKGDTLHIDFDFRPHFWVRPVVWQRSLELKWTVFGPVPRTAAEGNAGQPPACGETEPAWEQATAIPKRLTVNGLAYRPVRARSKDGILDGRRLFPASATGLPPTLYGFAEIASRRDEPATLQFSVDWWFALCVNGEVVFDSYRTGGGNGGVFRERNIAVPIRLRRGRNLLAFRLSGGQSKGCWLSLGRGQSKAEAESKGQVRMASIYRGPLLLAHDPHHQAADIEALPVLDSAALKLRPATDRRWLKPWLLFDAAAADGSAMRLCDFASAGMAGTEYLTWLPVRFDRPPEALFTEKNTLRSVRPAHGGATRKEKRS